MAYADPAKARAYQTAWLKRKRRGPRGDEVRETSRRCRARAFGAEGDGVPPGWEAEQLGKQWGLCYWCPRDIMQPVMEQGVQRVAYDADHVVPLCSGGEHTAANLVLACRPCNGARGGRWRP